MSIILISGGLDSATSLAWALDTLEPPHIPISFFYGQRHAKEQVCAKELCKHFHLEEPRQVNLQEAFRSIGGSSLTSGVVSGNPSEEKVERTASDLPPSFVPGRNLIMLGVAASLGYVEKTYDIIGGWNAVDYSGYPDCRPEFFKACAEAINLALYGKMYHAESNPFVIHAPLVMLTKEQIIELGLRLDVPYELTWSCYAGGAVPCGECDSCKVREAGFKAIGIDDPAL